MADIPPTMPTERPTFAPVERPPESCWLESVIVMEDEELELALLIAGTVAAAVASTETAVNSGTVVAVTPLEEPIAKVLKLISSYRANFILSYLGTNYLTIRERCSGQCYRMSSLSNIQ